MILEAFNLDQSGEEEEKTLLDIVEAHNRDRSEEEKETALLAIHLGEGFGGDTVQVWVAGRTVLDKEGVSTNYSVGLADLVKVDVAEGPVAVEIAVPTQELSGRKELEEVAGTFNLMVRIIEGHIEFETPPGELTFF